MNHQTGATDLRRLDEARWLEACGALATVEPPDREDALARLGIEPEDFEDADRRYSIELGRRARAGDLGMARRYCAAVHSGRSDAEAQDPSDPTAGHDEPPERRPSLLESTANPTLGGTEPLPFRVDATVDVANLFARPTAAPSCLSRTGQTQAPSASLAATLPFVALRSTNVLTLEGYASYQALSIGGMYASEEVDRWFGVSGQEDRQALERHWGTQLGRDAILRGRYDHLYREAVLAVRK